MERCARGPTGSSPRWREPTLTAKRLIFALPPLVLLAACGEEAPADDSRSASGEVLEGTISDAMLPVDTVSSQPPLADPEARRAAAEEAGEEADPAAAEGETGGEETPDEAPGDEADPD